MSGGADIPVFNAESANEAFDWIWETALLVLYVLLWLAPNKGLFSRRPALVYWARFWGVFRVAMMLTEVLFDFFDAAMCANHAVIFVGFGVLKVWITYRTFVLEARWWHGIQVSSQSSRCSWLWGSYHPYSSRSSTDTALLSDEHKINSPFESMSLSRTSAAAMLTALDVTHSTHRKKRVPLIDFTVLKIIPTRLLGQGSSARVYEGRWNGSAVAVKILFTMEITPEEVERTMLEASLLQSLQSVSAHVVRLHGIAMLPPSLCVVLEVCSEGSLYDFLQSHSNLLWEIELELALGACRGVTALVETLPGHSHNDIKSANFLVHADCCYGEPLKISSSLSGSGSTWSGSDPSVLNFIVKLADIEFASQGVTPDFMRRGDTPNWTAPEILDGTGDVSPASDVYALANVLYEIITKQVPFGAELDPGVVAQNIIDGRRPTFPTAGRGDCRFVALVNQAWDQDPSRRPCAAELTRSIEAMLLDCRNVSK